MQKTFLIEGMDCADCARHVEEGVQKLPGVQFARVDFATAQLVLEGEFEESKVHQRVQALGYRLKNEQAPIPEKPESFWLGLGRYLLSEGETRLALLGGAFLLISAGL
ncbi:MAG: cation transporter, partial [Anaerolinea sp.]